MAARRVSVARQRLAISRSAAGLPRTYRIVRSSRWGTRLAALLRKLVPAKVTRSALENAASVAGMILSTEALVTDADEDHPVPAAAGSRGAY